MSTFTSSAVAEHASERPTAPESDRIVLSADDTIRAYRIARSAHLSDPGAYADDLAAVDADPTAIAVYRLAADLRARGLAVAHLPVQGPVDDPFVCRHCQYRSCRVTHVVFCESEDDGNAVYVGARCARPAERFMEFTAINRVSKVRVDELDSSDREWLLETAQVS